jgi:hypothetical protein
VAKKDPSAAVLGMLSTVGSKTRPSLHHTAAQQATPAADPSPDTATANDAVPVAGSTGTPLASHAPAPGPVSAPPAPPLADEGADAAPRTLRLRARTAAKLRAAWVEAKRDDVFLTAQDFASNLIEEALAARNRRARSARSA